MAGRSELPLWTCPACRRAFANANQSHACGRHDLTAHFEGRSENVRAIYDAFARMLAGFGRSHPAREDRIAFQVRMSFAQLTSAATGCAATLSSPAESSTRSSLASRPSRHAITSMPSAWTIRRRWRWLKDYAREAYAVGRQDHLG